MHEGTSLVLTALPCTVWRACANQTTVAKCEAVGRRLVDAMIIFTCPACHAVHPQVSMRKVDADQVEVSCKCEAVYRLSVITLHESKLRVKKQGSITYCPHGKNNIGNCAICRPK